MRGLLAVVCALGCVVGSGQVLARDAQAQPTALAPTERVQIAEGDPSPSGVRAAAEVPSGDRSPARSPLPAGALLFAFAFWNLTWLTRRLRGERPAPANTERHVHADQRVTDAPARSDGRPPVGQAERRRGAERRSDDGPERRS